MEEILKFCEDCGNKTKAKGTVCNKCLKIRVEKRRSKRVEQQETKPPLFKCEDCGAKTQLDFFPNIDGHKWREFKCPNCNL